MNAARNRAEELVLTELVWLPPEEGTEQDDEEDEYGHRFSTWWRTWNSGRDRSSAG